MIKMLLRSFCTYAFVLLFSLPVHANALTADGCKMMLYTAYAPGMVKFVSCQSMRETSERIKIVIYMKGGIMGTPYELKGYVDISEDGWVQTRWKKWTSVLRPVDQRFKLETEKEKWDF